MIDLSQRTFIRVAQSFHDILFTYLDMKLVLLLLAIYSLIFYQSYKIEKLRSKVVTTKDDLNADSFDNNSHDRGGEYQNALLITTQNDGVYRSPGKKKTVLHPLIFY